VHRTPTKKGKQCSSSLLDLEASPAAHKKKLAAATAAARAPAPVVPRVPVLVERQPQQGAAAAVAAVAAPGGTCADGCSEIKAAYPAAAGHSHAEIVPLPTVALPLLRRATVSSESVSEDEAPLCSVCLEDFEDGAQVGGRLGGRGVVGAGLDCVLCSSHAALSPLHLTCSPSPPSPLQILSLPCRHQYHAECVTQWLRLKGVSATCPNCKGTVFSRELQAQAQAADSAAL
jgi:hypothetical protein